jgi:hypothetical protein
MEAQAQNDIPTTQAFCKGLTKNEYMRMYMKKRYEEKHNTIYHCKICNKDIRSQFHEIMLLLREQQQLINAQEIIINSLTNK